MRYMLDANAFILLLIGHPDMVQRVADCAEGDLGLSAIAFGEVALGSERGKPPSPDALQKSIRAIPVLPFDEAAAMAYARLPFARGSYDRLIAAHALSLGLTLVTANFGDFDRVPGLTIEAWAQ